MKKFYITALLLLLGNITMAKAPAVSAITGYYFYLCSGTTLQFFDGTPGGTWSINAADAGVAAISSTGVVSGLSAGTARISYTIGTSAATAIVTVYPTPAAITGSSTVCKFQTTLLSDATSGGTWSSGTPSLATIGTNGLVTAVNHGVATFYYTLAPAGCRATYTMTVYPYTPSIAGPASVCIGASATLSDISAGGTWSGSDTHASIDGTGGLTGLATGTTSITYTDLNGCYARLTVTVNPLPSPISGNLSVCTGNYTFLSDASTPALSWTSSTPSVATIVASGAVTGVAPGTSTITFTLTNGCKATAVVSVNPLPVVSAISGTYTVCAGSSVALTDTSTGGIWNSSNPSVASVNSYGLVTGLAGGTSIISYTVTNSCASVRVTKTVTVNPLTAGTISGTSSVATGTSISLSDGVPGGAWSASNSNATVSSAGLVTGIASGTVTISYTVTNGCGTIAATKVVTVYISSVAAITGTTTVCAGSNTALTDVTGGGTWSSANPAIASVSSAGIVTGVSAGSATISYTVAGASATAIVYVTGTSAGIISGASSVAAGSSSTLTDGVTGGVWSASNSNATISSVGVLTGITPGTVMISYSLANSCGSFYATKIVTINPSSGAGIIGNPNVCVDATTTLTDATPGGVWHSSNILVAPVTAAGVVTGSSVGSAIISYTVAGITTTINVVVNANPSGIGGPASSFVCNGASITLSDFTAGGVWTSTPAVSVTNGLTTTVVTGLTVGSAVITYSLATGCYKTFPLVVNAVPAAISGQLALCKGATTSLSDATTGGISWTSSSTSVATISLSAIVTGISAGTATISYVLSSGCSATAVVTVYALPVVAAITGPSAVSHSGSPITLSDTTGGGVWSSAVPSIATVGSVTGIVTAVASAGTSIISYLVTNTFGCKTAASKVITVGALPPGHESDALGNNDISPDNYSVATNTLPLTDVNINSIKKALTIVPNPNSGVFTVTGSLCIDHDEVVTLEITDMSGKLISITKILATYGIIKEQLHLDQLSKGNYLLIARHRLGYNALQFVVE